MKKVLVEEKKYAIGNIDVTLCLQQPKIAEYIPKMKETLTTIMKIKPDDLSIKATTTEKLGYVGREEGVSCYAVVLLDKIR